MAFGVIKHSRKLAHRAAWRETATPMGRRYRGHVYYEVSRTKSGRGTYAARACMMERMRAVTMTARFPGRMARRSQRCGYGSAAAPTLAIKGALAQLAKRLT